VKNNQKNPLFSQSSTGLSLLYYVMKQAMTQDVTNICLSL